MGRQILPKQSQCLKIFNIISIVLVKEQTIGDKGLSTKQKAHEGIQSLSHIADYMLKHGQKHVAQLEEIRQKTTDWDDSGGGR